MTRATDLEGVVGCAARPPPAPVLQLRLGAELLLVLLHDVGQVGAPATLRVVLVSVAAVRLGAESRGHRGAPGVGAPGLCCHPFPALQPWEPPTRACACTCVCICVCACAHVRVAPVSGDKGLHVSIPSSAGSQEGRETARGCPLGAQREQAQTPAGSGGHRARARGACRAEGGGKRACTHHTKALKALTNTMWSNTRTVGRLENSPARAGSGLPRHGLCSPCAQLGGRVNGFTGKPPCGFGNMQTETQRARPGAQLRFSATSSLTERPSPTPPAPTAKQTATPRNRTP